MFASSRILIIWLTALTLVFFFLWQRIPPPSSLKLEDPPSLPPEKAFEDPSSRLNYGGLNRVDNQTLGFGKIFVVNLASRTDHRDALALAASFTNLEIDWEDGILGDSIAPNARPFTEGRAQKLTESQLGCWRAHTNVLERIVEHNITSALILEGDADWDVRLKDQIARIAQSTRALTQPLRDWGNNRYADSTLLDPSSTEDPLQTPVQLNDLPQTLEPTSSPYGDNWDVIWLGHCAQRVPSLSDLTDAKQRAEMQALPRGHVLFEDETAPAPQYRHSYNDNDIKPFTSYPGAPSTNKNTRIVHHSMDGMCNSAYAVSQRGARKLLFQAGIEAREEPYDFMLQRYCGSDPTGKRVDYAHNPALGEQLLKRQRNICLTVQPPLFAQVKMKGAPGRQTDITKGVFGGLFGWGTPLAKSFTPGIRWSTRLNLGTYVSGRREFVDQWPDEPGT